MYNILTVGTGAIGALYGWRLSLKASVTAICRSNYNIVREHGFTLRTTKWGNAQFRPHAVVKTATEAASKGVEYDSILVTLKALPDVYNIPDIIRPAVTPGKTKIVLIQNGLGIEEPLAKAFPGNPLISVVAYVGVSQHATGEIDMMGAEQLKMGVYRQPAISTSVQQEALSSFVTLCRESGIEAVATNDIEKERWLKVVWNGSFSPFSVATGMNTAQMVATEENKQVVINLMKDVMRVAAAYGHSFDQTAVVNDMMNKTAKIAMGHKPSMLLDLENKRPMEVEVILGVPYKRALAKRIPVSYLESFYVICKALNERVKH